MKHIVPIITPRLILCPPTMADVDAIQAAKEDMWHDLQLWMSWAYDDRKSRSALEEFVADAYPYEDQANLKLAGFDKDTGDFVIMTGLDALEKPGVYATGYWVAKTYQGRGLATEACNAVLRYAFNHLNASEMHIVHYGGNEGSRRVIEKLGFTPLPVEPKAINRCLDGAPADVHPYVMHDAHKLPPLTVHWG